MPRHLHRVAPGDTITFAPSSPAEPVRVTIPPAPQPLGQQEEPDMPTSPARTKQLHVRVTQADLRRIEAVAAADGFDDIPAYVNDLLRRDAERHEAQHNLPSPTWEGVDRRRARRTKPAQE